MKYLVFAHFLSRNWYCTLNTWKLRFMC